MIESLYYDGKITRINESLRCIISIKREYMEVFVKQLLHSLIIRAEHDHSLVTLEPRLFDAVGPVLDLFPIITGVATYD
jgi:hypothetical protein